MSARARVLALLPLLAGLAVALAGLLLGQWQLRRAGEKSALQAVIERRAGEPPLGLAAGVVPEEWRRVVLRGRWLPTAPILVDNRVHQGRPGYHVIAPLELQDGRVVLVNRGWIAAAMDRSRLPQIELLRGGVELEGVVRRPQKSPFRLAQDDGNSRLRQNLVPAEIATLLGRPVEGWIVLQQGAARDGLVRDWPRPDAGIERHQGYALQWFGLAALAAGLTLFFGFRRMRDGHAA